MKGGANKRMNKGTDKKMSNPTIEEGKKQTNGVTM